MKKTLLIAGVIIIIMVLGSILKGSLNITFPSGGAGIIYSLFLMFSGAALNAAVRAKSSH